MHAVRLGAMLLSIYNKMNFPNIGVSEHCLFVTLNDIYLSGREEPGMKKVVDRTYVLATKGIVFFCDWNRYNPNLISGVCLETLVHFSHFHSSAMSEIIILFDLLTSKWLTYFRFKNRKWITNAYTQNQILNGTSVATETTKSCMLLLVLNFFAWKFQWNADVVDLSCVFLKKLPRTIL